jgi:hypothetical protein
VARKRATGFSAYSLRPLVHLGVELAFDSAAAAEDLPTALGAHPDAKPYHPYPLLGAFAYVQLHAAGSSILVFSVRHYTQSVRGVNKRSGLEWANTFA